MFQASINKSNVAKSRGNSSVSSKKSAGISNRIKAKNSDIRAKFSHLSIRIKLMLLMMAISSITLIPISATFIFYDSYKSEKAVVSHAELLAKLIGDKSAAAIEFGYKDYATENLESFQGVSSVQLACIYDFYGAVFASYNVAGRELFCPSQIEYGHRIDGNQLHLTKLIKQEDREIGSIYILSSLREIQEAQLLYSLIVGIMLLGAVALIYFITIRLQKIISQPIIELAEISQEISRTGQYERKIETSSKDELGSLYKAFDNMIKQIKQRDNELLESQKLLEVRVSERTKELRTAMEASEEANRSKSIFLANMSHELRTPMHAILSFSEFGIEDIEEGKTEESKKFFARINDSGKRLLNLINNLLDLSKLDAGMMEFDFRRNEFVEIIKTAQGEIQSLIMHKKINIIYDSYDENYFVVCDRSKIIQVMNNLLSNAIKFSPEGSQIRLTIKKSMMHSSNGAKNIEAIHFSIQDEGIGIPDDEIDKVFEQFVQSSKTSTGAGGTGLGLSICKDIISAHNGRIWAEPGILKGAKFSIVIPTQAVERMETIIINKTNHKRESTK